MSTEKSFSVQFVLIVPQTGKIYTTSDIHQNTKNGPMDTKVLIFPMLMGQFWKLILIFKKKQLSLSSLFINFILFIHSFIYLNCCLG